MIWLIENLLIFVVGRCVAVYVQGPVTLLSLPQTLETFVISSAVTTILLMRGRSEWMYGVLLIGYFLVKGHKENKRAKAAREREERIRRFHRQIGYVDRHREECDREKRYEQGLGWYEGQNYGGEP